MIFKNTWEQVLNRTKTQTRRPVKKKHLAIGKIDYSEYIYHSFLAFPLTGIEEVRVGNSEVDNWEEMRLLWKVNRTYAVQPGRGKKSVGRILLKEIRLEKLHEITVKDCIAEGINPPAGWNDGLVLVMSKRPPNDLWNEIALRVMSNFVNLWGSIYSKTEFAFENNPDVWVLEFELVERFQ